MNQRALQIAIILLMRASQIHWQVAGMGVPVDSWAMFQRGEEIYQCLTSEANFPVCCNNRNFSTMKWIFQIFQYGSIQNQAWHPLQAMVLPHSPAGWESRAYMYQWWLTGARSQDAFNSFGPCGGSEGWLTSPTWKEGRNSSAGTEFRGSDVLGLAGTT